MAARGLGGVLSRVQPGERDAVGDAQRILGVAGSWNRASGTGVKGAEIPDGSQLSSDELASAAVR